MTQVTKLWPAQNRWNWTCDILPSVNAGASRTAGGMFAGLRYDLFSRLEQSAFAVEQVYRCLCHTAVTSILAVRTRSFFWRIFSAPLQSTFPTNSHDEQRYNPSDTVRLRAITAPRTRLRGVPLDLFQHLDAAFFALVREVLGRYENCSTTSTLPSYIVEGAT